MEMCHPSGPQPYHSIRLCRPQRKRQRAKTLATYSAQTLALGRAPALRYKAHLQIQQAQGVARPRETQCEQQRAAAQHGSSLGGRAAPGEQLRGAACGARGRVQQQGRVPRGHAQRLVRAQAQGLSKHRGPRMEWCVATFSSLNTWHLSFLRGAPQGVCALFMDRPRAAHHQRSGSPSWGCGERPNQHPRPIRQPANSATAC